MMPRRPRWSRGPTGAHRPIVIPLDHVVTRPLVRQDPGSVGTVRVIPQAPEVPEVPVLARSVPTASAAVAAPLVTEVWLNRNILMGLQWDYRNLELFRAAVGDRYQLHQLAMRAPSTIIGGKS